MTLPSQIKALKAAWPDRSAELVALSFVFTEAPYCLSEFVFDAVIVKARDEFRRIDRSDLGPAEQDLLSHFQDQVSEFLLCPVGDILSHLEAEDRHQLLTGQGFVSDQTLTVKSLDGRWLAVAPDPKPTERPVATFRLRADCFDNNPEFLQWILRPNKEIQLSEEDAVALMQRFGQRLAPVEIDFDFEDEQIGHLLRNNSCQRP